MNMGAKVLEVVIIFFYLKSKLVSQADQACCCLVLGWFCALFQTSLPG